MVLKNMTMMTIKMKMMAMKANVEDGGNGDDAIVL